MVVDERLGEVLEAAQAAFWREIADSFPEVKTGDFPPDCQLAFDQACKRQLETGSTSI